PFLPPPHDPLRLAALHALIPIDLHNRWRHRQSRCLEYYVERYKELGTLHDLPAQLICDEYRIRHLYGDKPPMDVYEARFPKQIEQVQLLLLQDQRIATLGETPRPNPTRPAAREKAGEKGTAPFEFRGPVPFSPAGPQ